jgi:hypothetical protein
MLHASNCRCQDKTVVCFVSNRVWMLWKGLRPCAGAYTIGKSARWRLSKHDDEVKHTNKAVARDRCSMFTALLPKR